MTRRARKIYKKEKPTVYSCKQMLSALGLINSADVYRMFQNEIKPFVTFRLMRKRISNYDRRLNKCGIEQKKE